jgi:hypothetical protein
MASKPFLEPELRDVVLGGGLHRRHSKRLLRLNSTTRLLVPPILGGGIMGPIVDNPADFGRGGF